MPRHDADARRVVHDVVLDTSGFGVIDRADQAADLARGSDIVDCVSEYGASCRAVVAIHLDPGAAIAGGLGLRVRGGVGQYVVNGVSLERVVRTASIKADPIG